MDELTITGTAKVEYVVVIDYLHVSKAEIIGGSPADSVGTMDGSKDSSQPMGWVLLNLDFTDSLTKTIKISVTNANPTIKYVFYQPRCVDAYSSSSTTSYTASIVSGITSGTLNSQGLVVGGSPISAGGGSIKDITVTLTASEPTITTVALQMVFGFEGEADKQEAESQATVKGALEKFREALNDNTMYDRIIDEMKKNGTIGIGGNYVGNVVGSGTSDTKLINDIFGDTLKKVSFTEGGEERTCTVMIKRKNVTGSYKNPDDNNEMVLYMTTEDPTTKKASTLFSSGGSIAVYAIVFVYSSVSSEWIQYGDIYYGEATVNGYDFPNYGNDSFNTEKWKVVSNQTYTVKIEARR